MGVLNNNVLPFLLISWAQLHIETGLAAILNASAALFTALAAALLLRDERLTRSRALGLALGFAGVLAAIGPAALAGFDLRSAAQLAMLGATLGYALAGVWARIALPELAPEVAATGMLTAASAVILPLALVLDGPPDLSLAPATWAGLAYTSAVSTALAYLLYWRLIAAAGAANTMFVTLMIPPVAIALGALARSEVLPATAFLGLGLLALGFVVLDGRLAARFARRRPPAW
jgi:drug/metabolite transporter (DMT)-like permease